MDQPVNQMSASPVAASGSISRFKLWRLLLSLLISSRGWISLSVLLGVLTVGSSIGLLATSAWLISAAALQPSIAILSGAIVGVRFFGISRAVFRYLERLVSHTVTFNVLTTLRVRFYKAIEPLAPAGLQSYQGGDLLARIVADIAALEPFYVRAIAPVAVALIIGLFMLLFLGLFDPLLSLAYLPGLIIAGVGLPLLVYRVSRGRGQALINDRAQLQVDIIDNILGMADLIAYGQVESRRQKFTSLNQALAHRQRQISWVSGFYNNAVTLLSNLSMLVIVVIAISLVNQGQIDPIYLALLAQASGAAFEAFQPLPQASQELSQSFPAAARLFELIDQPPLVADLAQPLPRPQTAALQIRDLTFGYEQESPPVLRDLRLELPPGKWLALVGPSGGGKSTVVDLLCRFWPSQPGQITLAGNDLAAYHQDDVRSFYGLVAQDCHLFNASIRENIAVARPGADQQAIESAAQAAQIHEFITGLPQGYQTRIGELGLRLSGGERQRLLVARALLRQAPVLILDEPTANLDPITEWQLLETIFNLAEGRSLLLMTHRLVGLDRLDEIIVLKNGRSIERGRHADLVRAGGLYARMWRLQNQALD